MNDTASEYRSSDQVEPLCPSELVQPAHSDSRSTARLVDDTPPAWRRYGVAVVMVGLAWVLTQLSPPLHQVPSTLFFAAVTLTAFYGHLGPGLLATGLSTVALDYSFMAPVSNLASGLGEFVRVSAFAMASALINSLHERRRRAELERQQSEARERGALEAAARELEAAHDTVARALAHRENIMESIPDILYTVDLDGKLTGWNRRLELISGFPPEELKGKPALGLFFGGDTDLIVEGFQSAFKTGFAEREARLLRKDGIAVPYQFTAVPLKDGQGHVIGLTGVGRDLSERKRLEKQLRQAQKMEAIGRLAGGVAHDFGNLLTVIQGRAQLVLKRLGPGSDARGDIELIDTTAAHAGTLIHQLLAFSRRQTLQPNVLDLNAVVSHMEQILQRLIGEDIVLLTVRDPALGPVKADPTQLEQAIMNLAVNARDAMATGGKLTLETANVDLDEAFVRQHHAASAGPHVALIVSDTGVGMNAETKARIFEPFFTTKGVGRGTGLGLATVYGVVEQHGGYISVDSEPGRGTRFAIYLPRVNESVTVTEHAAGPAASGTETVLIVEDDQQVRTVACDTLRRHGYLALEAGTPEKALSICAEHPGPIHLLLTDVVMPAMNGYELANLVMPLRPDIRVAYMSGYTRDFGSRDRTQGPTGAFIQKPFTPEALARKVREALDAAAAGNGAAGKSHRPAR
jgi:two-component system cell cycle sensor histidine kinase/response regulator CckA